MYTQSPPLSTIRDWNVDFSAKDKKYICTTLLNAIQNYYVHLPIKEKAFAINPVQELKLLADGHFDEDDDISFLRDLQRIFLKFNDRHTTLVMPQPWTNLVAFIPVVIERYYVNKKPVYIVTKKLAGYENNEMEYGMRVTHWNGINIDRYIELLSEVSQGANRQAASKLALSNLTIRSLAYAFPPEEDWVVLTCVNNKNEIKTFSLLWRVYYNGGDSGLQESTTKTNEPKKVSLDKNQLTNMKFQQEFYTKTKVLRKPSQKYVLQDFGTVLKYGTLKTASGDVAYLRIFSFEVDNADTFITQIAAILKNLPQDKLIIDIRGNPGGVIPSGERLVQLLTDKKITYSPVAFRNTESTKGFGNIPDFSQWKKSLKLMDVSGEIFTQYYPLSTYENLPAYRYPGKVGLIIDSLVYSTADFMAADFKDNNIGPVIGVDKRTGGGGANVWTYENLVYYAMQVGNMDLGMLPGGLSLNIAMRRSIRTGKNYGLPVEDLGTEADIVYHLTANDLLNGNMDLINFAASYLDK